MFLIWLHLKENYNDWSEGVTTGWDDPRMPTISGLRRKGYTPHSIRNFIERVGVAKRKT
jgi:glutaminyl-tRNA synthetase